MKRIIFILLCFALSNAQETILVISNSNLYGSNWVNALTTLKQSQGYNIQFEFYGTGATTSQIKSSIDSIDPEYIMIVGDACDWDPEFREHTIGPNNFVPFKYTPMYDPWHGPSESDIANDDYYIQSCTNAAIGRIPARSISEIDIWVSKLIEHENGFRDYASWKNKVVLFTGNMDHPSNGAKGIYREFERDSIIEHHFQPNNMSIATQNSADYSSDPYGYSATRSTEFENEVNAGCGLINAIGVGAGQNALVNFYWSTSSFNFSNSGKYPVLMGLSCDIGKIQNDAAEVVIQRLLFEPDAGIISAIAPTTTTSTGGLKTFAEMLYGNIFSEKINTLGTALQLTKTEFGAYNSNWSWQNTAMQLYGDPTTSIPNYISVSNNIDSNTVWQGSIKIENDIIISNGAQLLIRPGTGLFFGQGASIKVYGNLIAAGTREAPIRFTSSDPSPAKGDWEGIRIFSTSDPSVTIVDNCVVEYAYFGIYVDGTNPTISNSTFKNNTYGLYSRYSSPSITSNQLLNNTFGARTYYASTQFTNNVFRDNSSRGLYSYGASTPRLYNNTIRNCDIGVDLYNHVDAQFGNEGLNTRGYNEIINNDIYGIYANSYCDPFLGTSDPYNDPIAGYNSIHGNGLSDPDVWGNVAANNSSYVEAEHNWWNNEVSFKTNGGSIDWLPQLSSAPTASNLGSSLAKDTEGALIASAGEDEDDCPEYDFFYPDTNSQCGLWHWAHDLRITNQLPVALYAWRLYVEKFPATEEASRALVKIVNFSPEEDRAEVIAYLKRVMQKHASVADLRIKSLELLVGEQAKDGDYPGAIGQATKLLAQAQNDDQEKIALYSLVELNKSFMNNDGAAQGFLNKLKARFPDDQLSLFAAELMGEEVDWNTMAKPVLPKEEPETSVLPEHFALYPAYPNPFNPITTIRYDLSEDAQVVLSIYDVTGRLVKTLATGNQVVGFYEVQWNGRSESGKALSSGLYLYRLQAGKFTANEKMLLLK